MSNVTSTSRPEASLVPATNPIIYNVTAVTAGTEYSQALSVGAKKFMIRCRDICNLKLAFTSGDSLINWVTISRGCVFSEENIKLNGSLFFTADKSNVVVEILEWT